jgi:hypothetical protein
MVALLLLMMAWTPQQATSDVRTLVVVIEKVNGSYVYRCNGRKIDGRRLTAEISGAIGHSATGWQAFVMASEDVSIGELAELQSLIGNNIGVRPVRLFGFSRRSGVMSEIVRDSPRWKLSFDGRLDPTYR